MIKSRSIKEIDCRSKSVNIFLETKGHCKSGIEKECGETDCNKKGMTRDITSRPGTARQNQEKSMKST